MCTTISDCSDQSFVQTVSLDHVIWKSKVYELISGQSQINENELEDHRGCSFGEWYHHGAGNQKYSHLRSFQRLEEPHRQVHEFGKSVITAYKRNDTSDIHNQLRMMESSSDQMQRCLQDLLNEIAGN
ncbi:CZB domain-containing protein [Litoribacillus peritrichatus]